LCIKLSAQNDFNKKIVVDTIKINFENYYTISDVSIIPFTETIKLRGSILKSDDYNFHYQTGSFTLSDSLAYSVFDTLIVTYLSYNTGLKKEYKKRSLVIRYDEVSQDTVLTVQTQSNPLSVNSIFGNDIEKSGTLVRGFTVGTTRDFTLQSGLRLQLSGRLSEEIEIVAALTDENTPIQPEGNTEKLEELDKVFIQIKHPLAEGTFGDYQLQKKYGEFGFVDRKLQGLLGEFNVDDFNGYVSLAGSRGKFNTNYITGIEGVQGPYRLSGINNERDIIVIAGTEKVFLDGVEMRRGEGNDYVIEYANAEITFTPNRLITSASRITVDFEYTDRRFTRNFFGAGSEGKFFDDQLAVQFQYLREGDDQDAPIDISLSDEDKNILYAAGDNRELAVKSGISFAQPDSAGNVRGAYEKIDTTLNGEAFAFYRYNPGNPGALYNLSFSYVGERKGDYTRESIGNFLFVGRGAGAYLPLVYLPLPELRQTGNLVVNFNPLKNVQVNLDLSGSLWDKNRLSDLDDTDNGGYARNILIKVDPSEIKFGDLNFGKAGVSYRDRFIQKSFITLDRINEIEFNRHYNVNTEIQEDEQLREISLALIPTENLNINSSLGLLRKGDSFKSNRYNNFLLFTDKKNYSIDYNFDYVESQNNFLKSYWLRQRGTGSYLIGSFKPGVEFLAEDRKDKDFVTDSSLSGSLKYHEINPFIEIENLSGFNLQTKFSMRKDYFPVEGIIMKESRSTTQYYQIGYSAGRNINSNLNITIRDKKYTQEFKNLGNLDGQTILVRSQSRFKIFQPAEGDLYYEVSTQRSARLQRVFIPVDRGNGNYIYLGDQNNNGIQDEAEFEPTLFEGDYILVTVPTDELFPVIDLKASTRWKIKFGEFFSDKSLLKNIFSPLSSETFFRLEENSREEDYKKIYLLQFSSFQNEDKTIRGSDYIQQDFFLWENSPELSFRLRFAQRKSLNQFSGGVERSYLRERSLRIKFKMIKEIGNQTDIVNETDNVRAAVSSNRRREIEGSSISTDFSYRPENYIEAGFRIRVERRKDSFPSSPTLIDVNSLLLRLNISFEGRGRLRAEVERNELLVNNTENFLPFELTKGNLPGKNYFWRLNFDYRISDNLQSTLGYEGRLQGKGKVINTLRAEARAYF